MTPPPAVAPAGINVIHTYRHLLRRLLRAVQHSSPAKYQARDSLRSAFRRPLLIINDTSTSTTSTTSSTTSTTATSTTAPATSSTTSTTSTTTSTATTTAAAATATTATDDSATTTPNEIPDAATIKRTLWFLDAAAREAGLEHRIVRNLLQVGWERRNSAKGLRSGVTAAQHTRMRHEGYRHYEMTIAMLNKTMGICLR